MRDTEVRAFTKLLDSTCKLLSRGAYQPDADNAAMWFRALAAHDLESIQRAFDAHVKDPQRGRFVPVPADILAQLEAMAADDGRPGPEEAWAIAVRSNDEAQTVVWTAEAAEAWAIARPVMQLGDEVGARMAFKEAYHRLVVEARTRRLPVAWNVSEGHDAGRRTRAIEAAVAAGRLPAPVAAALLPAPEGHVGASERVRAVLRELRDRLLARPEPESRDAAARRATAEAKAATAERVAAYQRGEA
jgi:hypothetical protein